MRTPLLIAATFGAAAAATATSSFVIFGSAAPAGTGALLARSLLLSFGVGAFLGAALTRAFRRTSRLRLGALYAALLGYVVNAFASSFSGVGGLPFDPAQMVFALMNHISLGALTGLAAWALLRLEPSASSPSPDAKARLLITALFASTALLICLTFVLPWEASGFVPTWRTPATAAAITTLPAALLAAASSAALTGYLFRAVSTRFGFLYVLLFGFYTVHAARTLGGALLGFYVDQRTTDLIMSAPPLTPGRASASFYAVTTGGGEAWRTWALPTLSVLASALAWLYLRARARPLD